MPRTTLFPPADGPRVFALPPGADFTRALVAGLDARLAGQPPEAIARVEIWVNTRRAERTLAAAFAEGPARLQPRLRVVTELADLPLPGLAAAEVSPLRRKLELARLVTGLARAEHELSAETAAFDLADSLAELLDEMQGEGIPLDAFASIDAAEHAAHWQRSLRFLSLIADYAASGAVGSQARMRAAADLLAARWAAAPPAHPVIVAGSTGSRAATRTFMQAVARLPQGALVLPGFDETLPPAVWARLDAAPDHPQHGFHRLAAAIGFDPATVPRWQPGPPPAPARGALVSLALRPAPVTDQWRAEGTHLAPGLADALAGVTWIEAPDQKREAEALALALREAAERGLRAALITPDRTLARRVTVELDRWGLIPDDSAGRPLALTPPGVLLRLVAELVGRPATPEALLALLKHPLTASAPGARGRHLGLTGRLERALLRGKAPIIDWPAVTAWGAAHADKTPEAATWAAWLAASLAPLAGLQGAPLGDLVAAHRTALEALATGPAEGHHPLWDKEAGGAALALLEALEAEADAAGPLTATQYRALLASTMAGSDVPEAAVVTHPGIAIWGTLEARVQAADRILLGGLTEGVWPRLPGADAWLGRNLRRALGLPSPEVQVGLSAHDFQQAMGGREVILSRALRDAEAPTVASRWLLRLENLTRGLPPHGPAALDAARRRGDAWLALAARLDVPAAPTPPARRPAPRPPVPTRPEALSVTEIQRLTTDPYAVYAKAVLGLRRLDPPGRSADAMARGTAIHGALDRFVTATRDGLGPDAEQAFRAAVQAALAEAAPWPAVRELWTAKLLRAGRWFLETEAERRHLATPAALEVKGRRAVAGLARPFAVTARADRIDANAAGVAIYDYKAGSSPSPTEARTSYLQLPLEGAIAEAGGFEGLGPARVTRLELLKLGAQEAIELDPDRIAEVWAQLATLIDHYQQPSSGFVARLRPGRLSFDGDYDHLARRGEWSDGDEPDPEVWTASPEGSES